MTDKLPVVGKRYRPLQKKSFAWAEFKKFSLLNDKILIFCNLQQVCDDGESNGYYSCRLTDFWERFEELPEDNLQETKKAQINEKGEVSKVERALEELKECIKNESTTKYRIIFEKAQNLVNALELESSKPITPEVGCGKKAYDEWIEACKKWKEEPETDIKEECVEPVSIWKDVSDLPEGLVDEGIVKWKRDFINSFEQMQKDIEELKKCKK